MKNLCICQYGHSRSVALAMLLQKKGEAAVAVGHQTSGNAIPLLASWADRIFILEADFIKYVPLEYWKKVVVFDVGRDKWSNPYSSDLASILTVMYEQKFPA